MASSTKKVFLFSGHMIDSSDRPSPRFPGHMADLAGRLIAMKLDEWGAGKGDLAYCGGACGGDILFAEACLERGLSLEVHLPMPEKEFLEASVSFAGQEWVDRFYKMKNHPDTNFSLLPENYRNEEGLNVFARNNLLQLDTAFKNKSKHVRFLALWNGQAGDGAGGTQHMVETVLENKGSTYIIKPQTM